MAAADFGFTSEPGRIAPGGTYAGGASGMGQFACSSCHDPHGRYRMEGTTTWTWTGPSGTGLAPITQPIWSSGSYGNTPRPNAAIGSYRLLAGRGYVPASSIASPFPFPNNPPVAVAPPAYNKSEAGSGANRLLEVRVAYGSGMSEWCQNCHTNIHLDNYVSGAMGASGLRHPAGQGAILKPGQYDIYNKYVSSGRYVDVGRPVHLARSLRERRQDQLQRQPGQRRRPRQARSRRGEHRRPTRTASSSPRASRT